MKPCHKCYQEKELKEFSKDKHTSDGLSRTCKTCAKIISQKWRENNLERRQAYDRRYYQKYKRKRCALAKQWKLDHPERNFQWQKAHRLRKKFNLTIEEKDKLQLIQENKCAICKRDFSTFTRDCAVDHDHRTGKIRGLLCNNCNSALGHFKDNIEVLKNAVAYILKHSEKPMLSS